MIENQAIIIEVNRTGTDGNGLHYERRSTVIDANGEPLEPVATEGEIDLFQLDRARFLAFRTAFPTRQDRRPAVYRRMFDASPDPTAPGSHNG